MPNSKAFKKALIGRQPKMFLLSVCSFGFSVLDFFSTVATPLYLYFQVLCQVLACKVEGDKSCDLLPENRFCTLQYRNSVKSPDHPFDLKFLHSKIYTTR